jgi:chemotaxis protein MotB
MTAALAQNRSALSDAEAKAGDLDTQIASLKDELERVQAALSSSESSVTDKEVEISNLESRLNQALIRTVDELNQSRSEFFGRLRSVLGDRPGVRIVGDRFIFQSEVLFAIGSADLQEGGRQQLAAFAATLKEIAAQFPPDVDWVLRIDGHTDRQQMGPGARFVSNWELSTERALSVLYFLVQQGVPEERLAAAGFGEFQPIDPGDSPEAYARNRRIELRLDARGESAVDTAAEPPAAAPASTVPSVETLPAPTAPMHVAPPGDTPATPAADTNP